MILAIESSIKNGSISILENGIEIGSYVFDDQKPMSENLVEKIENLIKILFIDKNKIRLIAVSKGPGSLTGIRVGISVAMGLAHSLNAKCSGVSTLKAMTLQSSNRNLISMIGAGRNQVYFQSFKNGKAGSITLIKIEQIKEMIEKEKDHLLVVENSLSRHFENLDMQNEIVVCPPNLAQLLGKQAFLIDKLGITGDLNPVIINEIDFKLHKI